MLRTHMCGELSAGHVGASVTLAGWVWRWRDHGGVVFIDLRDYTGLSQVVFNPEHDAEIHAIAQHLRNETVIQVKGLVRPRPEGTVNPKLPTGEIEVLVDELVVLNRSETPPFAIEDDAETSEELRLEYRFLDLRRPKMQRNLRLRHRAIKATRDYCDEHGFLEVETPLLTKSTPEGARDFLVPSRLHPGQFYALPQSPQIYKQILQVAGLDRYVQIAKCLRDEDLRADRQLEFTQIDLEMSFITEEDIYETLEGMMAAIWQACLGIDLPVPFPRMTWHESMTRYGSDKPDTRYGLELVDVGQIAAASDFQVLRQAVQEGGLVYALNAKGCGKYSRKDIDDLTKYVGRFGARGLAYIQVTPEGLKSSVVKFFSEDLQKQLVEKMNASPGDLILFGGGDKKTVWEFMGRLRVEIARRQGLVGESLWNFLWITEFPLFERDEHGNLIPMHHPFTGIHEEDVPRLATDPENIAARCYDLVLNGVELGSGSIRINRPDVQGEVFKILGIGPEEAEKKFGFLLQAFRYGAPPHGGFAVGLDRLVTLLCGEDSIREVVAFPKSAKGIGVLEQCPGPVDEAQLVELGLRLRTPGA